MHLNRPTAVLHEKCYMFLHLEIVPVLSMFGMERLVLARLRPQLLNSANFNQYGTVGIQDRYATAIPSIRLSVRLSVRHSKKVEDRIMKFSPYGSPIPLVFVG